MAPRDSQGLSGDPSRRKLRDSQELSGDSQGTLRGLSGTLRDSQLSSQGHLGTLRGSQQTLPGAPKRFPSSFFCGSNLVGRTL